MRRILPYISVAFLFASFYMVHSSGWTFGTRGSTLPLVFFLSALLAALFWHNLVLCARIEKLSAFLRNREQELSVLVDRY